MPILRYSHKKASAGTFTNLQRALNQMPGLDSVLVARTGKGGSTMIIDCPDDRTAQDARDYIESKRTYRNLFTEEKEEEKV